MKPCRNSWKPKVTTETIQQALADLAEKELGFSTGLHAGDWRINWTAWHATLVVAIEDHFEICFEPEDEEQIHTLEQLVALIQKKLANR